MSDANASEPNRIKCKRTDALISQNSDHVENTQNNTEGGGSMATPKRELTGTASGASNGSANQICEVIYESDSSDSEETTNEECIKWVGLHLIDNARHLRPIAGLLKALIKELPLIMTEIRVRILDEGLLHCYYRVRSMSSSPGPCHNCTQWELISYEHARDANAYGFLFQFLDLMVTYALLRMTGADSRRYLNTLLAMQARAIGIDKGILRGIYKTLLNFLVNSMDILNKMFHKVSAQQYEHIVPPAEAFGNY